MIVTIYTNFFSIISPTECIYGFHIIPRKAVINSRNRINRLVLVMEMQFVFCEIWAEFLKYSLDEFQVLKFAEKII
jgi:hypothetical protein